MSSTAPSRWTGESMHRRTRRRYAAERRFQALGFAAVAVSVLFLAFLLYHHGSKGLGGFIHYEAALPIDFIKIRPVPRPGDLRGPDAEQTVASTDLEGAISKAATAAYGRGAADMFGDAAITRARPGRSSRNPDMLKGKATLWLPVGKQDRHRRQGRGRCGERADGRRSSRRKRALRRAFNTNFLDSVGRHRPVGGRGVGGAQGQLPHHPGDDGPRFPDRRPRRDLSRGVRAAESLDRRDRGIDQQSRRGSLDHLRPARPRGVPQRHEPAALGAAGRRHDARADDHAGDRHRRPQRDQVRAAVDPRRCAGRRRVEDAGDLPSCAAAGAAGNPHRHDHRHGPRAWARPRRC